MSFDSDAAAAEAFQAEMTERLKHKPCPPALDRGEPGIGRGARQGSGSRTRSAARALRDSRIASASIGGISATRFRFLSRLSVGQL
jgi:hypothetical protein